MEQTVLVLGAKGRFGRHACKAFKDAGWLVHGFGRNWPDKPLANIDQIISGDAFDEKDIIQAANNCDVIVNALNPPYENWTRDLPRITSIVIEAAKSSGASVMIPGNVYNYGKNMPPVLTEDTAHNAITKKGLLRIAMEKTYKDASVSGIQIIIVRGGDFIEREKTGNWFGTYIIPNLSSGKIVYPGPLNQMHAWAYLPDISRAMVGLAEKRGRLGRFSRFDFEGFNLTGLELITAIEKNLGRKLKVNKMPWPIMKLLGFFSPSIREVVEMRYLWQVPHAIDGAKLHMTLPDFTPTSLDDALNDALSR